MNPVTKLEQHRVLLRAGQPIDQVYFVDSGLVSLLAIAKDGRAVETGVVGGGGVVGADVILGTERAATQAIAALAGAARSMPISQFLTLVESSRPLRDDMLRSLDSQLFHPPQDGGVGAERSHALISEVHVANTVEQSAQERIVEELGIATLDRFATPELVYEHGTDQRLFGHDRMRQQFGGFGDCVCGRGQAVSSLVSRPAPSRNRASPWARLAASRLRSDCAKT